VTTGSSLALAARRAIVEAGALGLAYGAGLCWASTCAVASFRVQNLAQPYWNAIPGLRTDTCGAVAFVVLAVSLATGRYQRRERLRMEQSAPLARRPGSGSRSAVLAVSETVAVLSTGLVAYLSVNAVTHPATLAIRATHFAPWPTEGTLRMLALAGCVLGVAVLYYYRTACGHRHREAGPADGAQDSPGSGTSAG
jgi:hypothetical protein